MKLYVHVASWTRMLERFLGKERKKDRLEIFEMIPQPQTLIFLYDIAGQLS